MTQRDGRRVSGRLVAVVLAVFIAGGIIGAVFFGDVGETPCWQVTQNLEPARKTLALTFGADEEGQAALATLRETSQRRPDCFLPATRELYNLESDAGGTDFATESTSG